MEESSQAGILYRGYMDQLFGPKEIERMHQDAVVQFLSSYFQNCSPENFKLLTQGVEGQEPLREVVKALFPKGDEGKYKPEKPEVVESIAERVINSLRSQQSPFVSQAL